MFADRKYKKGIGVYVFAVLLLIALFSYMGWRNWKNDQDDFLNAHTSTTAVVVDKYIKGARGSWAYYVTADHEAVNKAGENLTVSHNYWVTVEDYPHIEVGDKIETRYVKGVGWQYVSFEKVNEGIKVCTHCGGMFDTAYCGDCGSPMNPEG